MKKAVKDKEAYMKKLLNDGNQEAWEKKELGFNPKTLTKMSSKDFKTPTTTKRPPPARWDRK